MSWGCVERLFVKFDPIAVVQDVGLILDASTYIPGSGIGVAKCKEPPPLSTMNPLAVGGDRTFGAFTGPRSYSSTSGVVDADLQHHVLAVRLAPMTDGRVLLSGALRAADSCC